jgi:hypothetical protein
VSGYINESPELVPRAASLLNDGIWMDGMNAGSWRQLGTHARDDARDEGFLCARVVSCGRGNVGHALCSHAIPHVIERRPDMVLGPGDAVGHARTLCGRVAARAHFDAPCILDEPGVDLLVMPQR